MSRAAKSQPNSPVELHQRVPAGLPSTTIRTWARRWLNELGVAGHSLSIATVGPTEMRRLNGQWRRLDRPTNVLSFAYDRSHRALSMGVWGEVILCPAVIRKELGDYDRTYRQHFLGLLQHGLIHLTGRDHTKTRDVASWQRLERKLTPPQ